jgi:hypothetical protein
VLRLVIIRPRFPKIKHKPLNKAKNATTRLLKRDWTF